jgi:DNA-binding NtrC family response regulator
MLAAALGRTPSRVHVRSATEDLRLNDVHEGVLVVHEIHALSSDGQEALFEWMEEMGSRVRIICLTEYALYELVEQRRFRADLYYRLCVIHMATV